MGDCGAADWLGGRRLNKEKTRVWKVAVQADKIWPALIAVGNVEVSSIVFDPQST